MYLHGLDESVNQMELSTGLLEQSAETMLNSSTDGTAGVPIEQTWGQWLPRCVLTPHPSWTGSTRPFGLGDIEAVLHTETTNTLNDPDQAVSARRGKACGGPCAPFFFLSLSNSAPQEEMCLFRLHDGRIVLVWVAHCVQSKCCGRCLGSIVGYVASNGQACLQMWRK